MRGGDGFEGVDRQPETVRTVAGQGTARIEIRGSMFVGHVAPAESVEAAEAVIDAMAAEHDDATHVVPAYRVRDGSLLREWSSDAGEPTGSAGKPALNVLVRRGLEEVVAVVIRWFGGTKLGIGGLARAYAQTVSRAVDDAGEIERQPRWPVAVEVDYDDSGTVRGLLESAGVSFEAAYGATVRFAVRVPVDEAEELVDRVRSATGGRARVDIRP